MPLSNSDLLKIIEHFLPGDSLSFKLYEDGSLVVIADTGKKHTFSADQVASVHQFLNPKPKTNTTKPKTAAATAPKSNEAEAASSRISRMPTSREVGPAPSKPASKPKSTP
jgi:hypothetical protein